MRTACFMLGIIALVGGAAPAGASAADAGQGVMGTLVLADGFGNEGSPCTGTDKFADIHPGAAVTLKDQRKGVVGSGVLGEGTWEAAIVGSDFVNCEFPFAFPVSAAKRYVVQVGSRKVGVVSQKALRANDWTLTITIG